MKNHTYEFVDYDIYKCIACISRWMQAFVTEISTGNVIIRSILIQKKPPVNMYFSDGWSLIIQYAQKEPTE